MRYLSIIVGLLAVIFFLFWRLSIVSADRDSTAAVLQEKEAEITYFKAHSGKIVGVKPAAEISAQDFQNQYSGLAAELRDIKVKVSSLKAVLKASMEATGEGRVIVVRDTIVVPGSVPVVLDSIFISDPYLNLSGKIKNSEFRYKYSYYDSILFTLSTERKWFLGKEKLIGQVRMSNPNSRATGQTSILISEKKKRFNISAGVSYLPFENRFAPTVGIGFNLLRF